MCSSHAGKIRLELVAKTTVHVAYRYASYAVVLAVFRNGYVFGGTVPSLMEHNKQRDIIQYIHVTKPLLSEFSNARNLGATRVRKIVL